MEKVLKNYGLQYDSRQMEIKDIKSYIRKKIPIILLVQARSGKPRNYKNDYQDGHRVVAIGYQKDKIFFEDPYTFKRTFLREKELQERRHSQEKKVKIFNHGIAVYSKRQTFNSKEIIHME
jgi:uncharacterized protein YvpB